MELEVIVEGAGRRVAANSDEGRMRDHIVCGGETVHTYKILTCRDVTNAQRDCNTIASLADEIAVT